MRIDNSPSQELMNCAAEKLKILRKRILEIVQQTSEDDPCSMFYEDRSVSIGRSPITTHVLDTCRGRPAAGVLIILQKSLNSDRSGYQEIARGTTNEDGRIGDLLSFTKCVTSGVYRMKFMTGEYLSKCRKEFTNFYADVRDTVCVSNIALVIPKHILRGSMSKYVVIVCFAQVPFYPEVNVDFEITEAMCNQHFHIPCLLTPYGYSTYRGS